MRHRRDAHTMLRRVDRPVDRDEPMLVQRLSNACLQLVRIDGGTPPWIPGRIVVSVSPHEMQVVPTTPAWLAVDVALLVRREIGARGWTVRGPLCVSVVTDAVVPPGRAEARAQPSVTGGSAPTSDNETAPTSIA